jgi:hypothetical protein
MAITIVQSVAGANVSGSSQTIALAGLGANPNILSFLAAFGANAGGASAASDSVNGSHARKIVDAVGIHAALFAKLSSGAGTPTVTVSPNTTDWFGSGAVEFSGAGVVDDGVNSNSGTGTTQTGGAIVTTGPGVVFGLLAYYSGTRPTPDTGAGWAELLFATDLGFEPYSLIYQVTSGAGTYTPTWTTGSAITFDAVAVAFKETGGGPAGPLPFRTRLSLRRQ